MHKAKGENVGINPFIFSLSIPVTRMVEHKGSEVNSYLVEREGITKLYHNEFARFKVQQLSECGLRLLVFIAYKLEPGEDIIKLNPKEFVEYSGLSLKSFYNAVNSVQSMAIIAPVAGKKSTFWINPSILFCGSRIAKYPDNVVVKSTFNKK